MHLYSSPLKAGQAPPALIADHLILILVDVLSKRVIIILRTVLRTVGHIALR